MNGISILYKNAKDAEASWQHSWIGLAGDMAVRIRVNVSGETVEKIVVPQANSPAIAE